MHRHPSYDGTPLHVPPCDRSHGASNFLQGLDPDFVEREGDGSVAAHASRCTRSKELHPIQSSTRARSDTMTDASSRFVCLAVSNTKRAPRTSGHNDTVPFRCRSGCILSFRLGTIVQEARMHLDLPHASPPPTSSPQGECVREYVLKRTSPALPTLRLRNPPWFAGIGFPDRVVGVPWVSNPRRTSSAVFAVLSFGRTTSNSALGTLRWGSTRPKDPVQRDFPPGSTRSTKGIVVPTHGFDALSGRGLPRGRVLQGRHFRVRSSTWQARTRRRVNHHDMGAPSRRTTLAEELEAFASNRKRRTLPWRRNRTRGARPMGGTTTTNTQYHRPYERNRESKHSPRTRQGQARRLTVLRDPRIGTGRNPSNEHVIFCSGRTGR